MSSENVPSGCMRTAKARIRLRGCAVWSGPLYASRESIEYYGIKQRQIKARMKHCACESAHFAKAWLPFFALRGSFEVCRVVIYRSDCTITYFGQDMRCPCTKWIYYKEIYIEEMQGYAKDVHAVVDIHPPRTLLLFCRFKYMPDWACMCNY